MAEKERKRFATQRTNDEPMEFGFRENLALNSLVVNAMKETIMGMHKNQQEALYESFGYKRNLSFDDFMLIYKRQGIGKRIIDATVDFTWKDFPVFVDEDDDANEIVKPKDTLKEFKQRRLQKANKAKRRKNDQFVQSEVDEVGIEYTPFEESMYEFQKRFPLLRLCKKADTLNCIGQFSIMVIGTCVDPGTDDKRINELKEELPKGTGVDDIAFINVYSESQVNINSWEQDSTSPRYGLPKMYNISVNGEGGVSINHQVHWTRVIHIAEDLLESEVYGTPKLEAVYNDLQDILKVVGGSAEMFWLGAYQGLVFNVKDGYQLGESDAAQMTEQIENYVNKLQRFMKTKGVEVTSLQTTTADPRGNFDVLLKLVSGASNIPVRILIGSEQGQLAASVDQDTFFSYITSRRNSFVNEAVLKPLVDRLVEHGYLVGAENNEYFIKWPPLFEQTQTEKLTNAGLMVSAIKSATPFGNALDIITPEEVRSAVGLDEEIPQTQYDQFAEEGDALFEDEIDSLPTDGDDTQEPDVQRAIELWRARKNGGGMNEDTGS